MRAEAQRKYQASLKGKAAQARYRISPKGRAAYCKGSARYRATEKGKITNTAYAARYKAVRRRTDYGLEPEIYEAMISAQGGKCAMCPTAHSIEHPLQVDHCHTSNGVRGLLCGACNSTLGYARDDTTRLQAAIIYLENGGHSSRHLIPHSAVREQLN